MAVFLGGSKNSAAARAALKINRARGNIIDPVIKKQYPSQTYEPKHVTAIDTSPVFVARTGIRGANDLVWVGRAANHAAKMAAFSPDSPSRIGAEVYNDLNNGAKFGANGGNRWEQATWTDMNRTIYRSTWWWSL